MWQFLRDDPSGLRCGFLTDPGDRANFEISLVIDCLGPDLAPITASGRGSGTNASLYLSHLQFPAT